jgi:hypothetical protein
VFPKLSPVIFSLFVSCLILFAFGFVLKRLMEDDGLPAAASWCLALAPAVSGNFLWFGMIGMEHLLFLLLSLMLIRGWFVAASRRGRGDLVLLSGVCLLLVLTRPEGIFLVLLLFFVRGAGGRPMRDWLAALGGAGFGMAILAVINWMTSGHLSPQTMKGRQFLAGGRNSGSSTMCTFWPELCAGAEDLGLRLGEHSARARPGGWRVSLSAAGHGGDQWGAWSAQAAGEPIFAAVRLGRRHRTALFRGAAQYRAWGTVYLGGADGVAVADLLWEVVPACRGGIR